MIDTHAHLLHCYSADEIVSNMAADGLDFIVTIGTNVDDSKQAIRVAEKFEKVYASVGIYPENTDSITEDDLNELKDLAKHEKVVAIGEIGLDFHNVGFNKDKQKEIFVKQLEIADEVGLPFCVHCRAAAADLYEVLKDNQHLIRHSGLMHCYSEGKEWVQKFLDLGLYISFSGNITYKKSDRSFLKDIPLDKILVETDAPYLSPEPLRGKKNEPKNVRLTAEKIANELGLSFEEFEKITTANARKFYFKIKD